ncbi:YicC family protein [Magnetospira thiophila]
MTVFSMTGFARVQGDAPPYAWTWEAKSVNGKGLDVRLRLPVGFENLEQPARQSATQRLGRGNIYLTLDLRKSGAATGVRINREVLEQLLATAAELRQRVPDLQPPTLDGLLGLRGVLEVDEDPAQDEESRKATEAALLASLDRTLEALVEMRAVEGEHLDRHLTSHLDRIADLCTQAENLAACQPEAIRARLARQVSDLLDAVPALPEERLAQEAALLMTKADIREELDRLQAHIAAARDLLAVSGPVGRKLDFLCQEFNREANTLCSKSADTELTQVGLELKAVVEQLREQVQNVE